MVKEIKELFKQIFDDMALKVAEETKSQIFRTEELNEALEWVEEGKGVAEIPFHADEECAADIEKRVDGLTILGFPGRYLKFLNKPSKKLKHGEMNRDIPEKKDLFCPVCSKKVKHYWTIARKW